MFAFSILLRRLFTRRPSPSELNFYWWFVACGGINNWHRHLAAQGFIFSRRNRIIRCQERVALKLLEVWDTERFHVWKATGKHPRVFAEEFSMEALGNMIQVGDADVVYIPPTTHDHPTSCTTDHDHPTHYWEQTPCASLSSLTPRSPERH